MVDRCFRPIDVRIVQIKGKCTKGHKVGDKFSVDTMETGGMCGNLYHTLFPVLMTLEYGGTYPWLKNSNKLTMNCPDKVNQVTVILERDSQK